MHAQGGKLLADKSGNPKVLHDHGVNADPLQFGKFKSQSGQLSFLEENIESDKYFHMITAGERREFPEVLKREIFRAASSIELFESKIDGIGTGLKCCKKLLTPACWSEDLGDPQSARNCCMIQGILNCIHDVPLKLRKEDPLDNTKTGIFPLYNIQ